MAAGWPGQRRGPLQAPGGGGYHARSQPRERPYSLRPRAGGSDIRIVPKRTARTLQPRLGRRHGDRRGPTHRASCVPSPKLLGWGESTQRRSPEGRRQGRKARVHTYIEVPS